MTDKAKRAKEIQSSIRKILMEDWDPLDVKAVPEAQDEYDIYIGGVYRLLADGASAPELVNHLAEIETGALGGEGPGPGELMPVVWKLMRLDVSLCESGGTT